MAAIVEIITEQGSLDLLQGVEDNFYVTRQIHDLNDFQTRNADFTKQIQVPPTPRNVIILDAYGDNKSNTIPCRVLMNGVLIAPNARLLFNEPRCSHNQSA